ncbi:fatty acyl-AMP ligase [Paucibacter sp. APW11]|uniref:Fatty acyl-AMP ligase n=1 Tax=Roseateles aquae TaxID=3077235 RepID=A0ABU3PHP9_9BURK|nr:fatty acyl-AMP ligase [Paucibacter sp. APW11]MDT9002100.1 fatty acyl-AMP ligase [Paucibacter sp. APW11]
MNLLPDLLVQRACQTPQALAYGFLQGDGEGVDALSCGALFEQAAALAALLQRRFDPQSRLLLVCQAQKQFVLAFYACMLAGMIAVPTALPRRQALAERLRVLIADADAQAALTDADALLQFAQTSDGAGLLCLDLRGLSSEMAGSTGATPLAASAAQWQRPDYEAAPVAFLQYTSGSTGKPKGVVVSHENLRHNSALIQAAMGIGSSSAVLTALPMFHDMGLVGGLLQPMYSSCPGYWMTPAEFVQFPQRWLERIARLGITTSGGPNFMYDLVARQVDPAALAAIPGFDLGRWQVAFCGAEPIRAATVERFCERFAPLGFDAGAFYPCYGMAESTLFITGKRLGTPWRQRRSQGSSVVSCGVPSGDTEIRIVDPATSQPLPAPGVGEIWVRSGSVAGGYWRQAELSAQGFGASLADGSSEHWLRTGDLGYFWEGELFVTGRLKDLIIVNGKKHAPQDIEEAALDAHDALREAGAAAFVADGQTGEATAGLVLVCELKREWLRRSEQWPAVAGAVRAAVRQAYALTVDDIVFLKPGALPRTSSGKVMRAQCRTSYLARTLERAEAAVLQP